MNTARKTIVVGLSGGVDSAVAALRLKAEGHHVIGIFMQNWEADRDDPYCTAEQDLSDAAAVAKHLNISFEVVNFAREYWDNVFQYCLDEFHAGRTPNPDIGCNSEIKFKAFLKHALSLGADAIATGHYARITENHGHYALLKGIDPVKDQSYFLYTLGQYELAHALFPLGEFPKTAIRKMATEAGLPNHDKKDSTGICFIGERHFKTFLQEYILAQPGDIYTVDGNKIGKHDGLMFYTLGQRKGLGIGGHRDTNDSPWYVVDKDLAQNRLIVGQGHDHPRLYRSELSCDALHWVRGQAPTLPLKCHARTRYHQADQACSIQTLKNGQANVVFKAPQRAITPGQSVVFYQDEQCLGGGIIRSPT